MNVEYTGKRVSLNGNEFQTGQLIVDLLNYNSDSLTEETDKLHSMCEKIWSSPLTSIDPDSKYLPLLVPREPRQLLEKLERILKEAPFYKFSKETLISPNIPFYLAQVAKFAPILDNKPPQEIQDDWHTLHRELQEATTYAPEFTEVSNVCRLLISKIKNKEFEHANYFASNMRNLSNTLLLYRPTNPLKVIYKIIPNKKSFDILESYELKYFHTFVCLDFFKMLQAGYSIEECKNCGKNFLVTSGYSFEYCNDIPEGETRPCSEIGPLRAYAAKVKGDPFLSLYNRSYKTHFARRKKKKMTDNEFNDWGKEAKLRLQQAKSGKITLADFAAWLKI